MSPNDQAAENVSLPVTPADRKALAEAVQRVIASCGSFSELRPALRAVRELPGGEPVHQVLDAAWGLGDVGPLARVAQRIVQRIQNPAGLKVERNEVTGHNVHRGPPCWGITDGKRWFFYGYRTEAKATAMLPSFSTPLHVSVNITQAGPMSLVD